MQKHYVIRNENTLVLFIASNKDDLYNYVAKNIESQEANIQKLREILSVVWTMLKTSFLKNDNISGLSGNMVRIMFELMLQLDKDGYTTFEFNEIESFIVCE